MCISSPLLPPSLILHTFGRIPPLHPSLNSSLRMTTSRRRIFQDYLDTRLRAHSKRSTLLSFSVRESNPNGKMNRIKKEAGLSSRFPRLNLTRRKFMKTSPSSLLVAPFSTAKKSMDLDSSHPKSPIQSAIVSRSGSTSTNQTLNLSLTIKLSSMSSSRT